MGIEFRLAEADEMAAFEQLRSYAFADHRNDWAGMRPPMPLCAFVDGTLSATSGAWAFTLRWNGRPVAAAGITMIATSPEVRRRGLLRGIMERALPAYREQGQPIAVLWASFAAIYQRFGFGLASQNAFYRIDPTRAGFADEAPLPGRVERVPADRALACIKPLYVEHATPRTLALHRGAALWNFTILRAAEGEGVFTALYRAEDGTARGYVVYDTSGPPAASPRAPDTIAPFQDLVVRDWVALDAEAYRGLWQFLRAHDLVRTLRLGPLPMDDPAPLLLAEPRQLHRRVNDGLWLRVIDVEAALAQRGYTTAGEITIEVRGDSLCDWNDGCYHLESGAEGGAHVKRVRSAPDLVLPPRSLATLLAGQASASSLYHAGLLDGRDPDALLRADALFAPRHAPHCPDSF